MAGIAIWRRRLDTGAGDLSDSLSHYCKSQLGQSHLSGWEPVNQALIDSFADCTRDWNFLHVDAEAAAATPFGGTIAHGFLVLSLLAPMRSSIKRERPPGMTMGVNYGIDRLRFIAPVRSGSRIRARFTVDALDLVSPEQLREVVDVLVEIEGEARPAIAAQWLTMYFIDSAAVPGSLQSGKRVK